MNNLLAIREQNIKSGLLAKRNSIESFFNKNKEEADRFLATALSIGLNPILTNCSETSIVKCLLDCALYKLFPVFGQAYIVPYKTEAQLQLGYKGYVQLLYRAGWFAKAYPVYECDYFNYEFDENGEHIKYKPDFDKRENDDSAWCYDNLKGVYCTAKDSKGNTSFMFVPKKIIEKLRLKSQNQSKCFDNAPKYIKDRIAEKLPVHIWEEWYEEMALAKAIKKFAKSLPIADSVVLEAIKQDDMVEAGDENQTIDISLTPTQTPKNKIEQLIDKEPEEVKEDFYDTLCFYLKNNGLEKNEIIEFLKVKQINRTKTNEIKSLLENKEQLNRDIEMILDLRGVTNIATDEDLFA